MAKLPHKVLLKGGNGMTFGIKGDDEITISLSKEERVILASALHIYKQIADHAVKEAYQPTGEGFMLATLYQNTVVVMGMLAERLGVELPPTQPLVPTQPQKKGYTND